MASREMIEPMLAKTDMMKYGGDLIQAACKHGKHDILELLIERGADALNPPEFITGDDTYRKTPFLL